MDDLSPPRSEQASAASDNEATHDPASTGTGPKKRRRATIACRECRVRKTKCDHIVPVSGSDTMLRGMSKTAQAYIRSLERRVRNFEDRHHDTPVSQAHPVDLSTPTPAPSRHRTDEDTHTIVDSEAAPSREWLATHAAPLTGTPALQQRQTITSTNPDIFLGGKAGESFTQLILNAMNIGSVTLETQTVPSPLSNSNEQEGSGLYAPPLHARELIRIYCDHNHLLMPIFHLPSIQSEFEQVLSCDDSASGQHDDVYTLATMNMVCAIATAHNRMRLPNSESTARNLYDRAMILIRPMLLLDWRIEKVQILLLGTRYLQIASYPDECWNVLGLAIRIAYGLELHYPPPDHLDCITKEVRKRVWYACFGFDQLLSIIYGRPAATSTATFTTPPPEDLDDDCVQPGRLLYPSVKTPSSTSFFLHVSGLCWLLESAASLREPVLEDLVRLDDQFEAWYAAVPASLRIRAGVLAEDKTLILALRANMVRILIHRQSLVSALSALSTPSACDKAVQGDPSKSLGNLRMEMLQRSRRICVSTAEETIQLIAQRHEQTKDAMGPSWFNLYYLFNAILIIVSHVVDPQFHDDRSALAHLEQAVRMIRQMSANHTCAQRAYTFLQHLLGLLDKRLPEDRGRIFRRQSRSRSPPGTRDTTRDIGAMDVGVLEATMPDKLVAREVGMCGDPSPDLWAFWDSTHDLTADLGSQLEMYSAMGSGMWAWEGQDSGNLDI